jgi:hypothetical protein
MSNVLAFPKKDDKDPWDDEVMCTVTVNGKGEVELILNVERIETAAQYNWLIAKVSEAVSRLIDHKISRAL